ncbi:serine threonine protein kinase [Stylonychia lemnae]|uniref:Serine threonine protein kinase n=1 Tax=Stylonychia lemnae TaxID=5949 RepID=A0A077ZST5_STYLE|nr:serine threonine protein kinase [Stylonychia lemnae]|eukprot:CDW71536.1 serine threonine protein kinase [Stylonychia lemnae]
MKSVDSSEQTQPLLQGQQQDQLAINNSQSKGILPKELNWIMENYKEVDYTPVESRIHEIPFAFHQCDQLLQQIIVPHKNMLLIEYVVENGERERWFKNSNGNSKMVHQLFNGIDYIFYQETISKDTCIYLTKLEDLEFKQEKSLAQFKLDKVQALQNALITDEFDIYFVYGINRVLFRCDQNIFTLTNQNSQKFYEVQILSEKDYNTQIAETPNKLFVPNDAQSYHQLYGHYSLNQSSLQNHYVLRHKQKTYIVDKKSLDKTQVIDKNYHAIRYLDVYEYLMDDDFNLYKYDVNTNQLQNVKQLYSGRSISYLYKMEISPSKLIFFFRTEDDLKVFLAFETMKFELVNEIQKVIQEELDTLLIDTVNNRFYFRESDGENIRFINFNTYYQESHNLEPVVYQNKKVFREKYEFIDNHYLLLRTNQDLFTRTSKQITSSKYDVGNYFIQNPDIFYDENFAEIVKQRCPADVSETVDAINSEDIILRVHRDFIYLNGNKKVDWPEFRERSDIQFKKRDKFCPMVNRFNEKQYVLDLAADHKIVYFDKKTQEFKTIDIAEDEEIPLSPQHAYLDEELGVIVIKTLLQVKIYSLVDNQRIKDITDALPYSSIFVRDNYIQVHSNLVSYVLFFKDKKVVKLLQIQQKEVASNFENLGFYQEDINSKSYQMIKRKNIYNSEIYIMAQNSFVEMFNEQLLTQPVFPALQFNLAQKIVVGPSQVQLFVNGEDNMVGYFDIAITDTLIVDYRQILKKNNEQIVKELQSNPDRYFKYVSGFGTCFSLFQNNLIALETIAKQLSLKDKSSLPILICQRMLGKETPLDISLKNKQQKILNLILSMIIKYQDHFVFNQLVDNQLCELIKQQIDLQEYFDSNLPSYQILDPSFPNQHPDDEDDPMVSIEYLLINLPTSLTKNPRELMQVLSESDCPEYFENQIIQSIIKLKWDSYTKSFYQHRFYIFLIFMAFFVLDIFHSAYFSNSQPDSTESEASHKGETKTEIETKTEHLIPYIWVQISTKVVCSIVLLYFLSYEVKQMIVQKASYFSDAWNYFDFLHIIAYILFCVQDFADETSNNLILLKIIVIALTFMKLFFFIRIYDGFSFLVQMMGGVFKDIKYFISFFLIIICLFGMIFLVLFRAQPIDEYKGVDQIAYFLMAFRVSSGDFQLDDYSGQEGLLVLVSWIIWILAVFTLNIVFMNFIIAVISESYERVMQKLVAESYKVKANMIVEKEQLISTNDLTDINLFPNFIVVRRPLSNDSNEAGEWQGFIKDIKYTIRTAVAKSKGEIIQNLHQSLEKINSSIQQSQKKSISDDSIENKLQKIKDQLDSKVDSLDTKVVELKNDMNFIRSSIAQILQNQNQQ